MYKKKAKRIQAILLLVLILMMTSAGCVETRTEIPTMRQAEIASQASYTDIKNSWAYESISYVLNDCLFDGTSSTTFSPNKTITRTAFATVLARMSHSSDDVSISNGSSNLTREEMAVLLFNYIKSIGLPYDTASAASFTDSSKIGSSAKEAVCAVTSLGLMSGKSGGSFNPSGTTTRAEAATVIYRLCKLVGQANTSDELIAEISKKTASIYQYENYKNDDYQTITLKGTSISFSGTGALVDSNIIIIKKAGTYVISGTLKDGRIIVNSDKNENVRLVLNNAAITSAGGSPIIVKNVKNTMISLPSGTKNTITDNSSNTDGKDTMGAISSKDDLRINGKGTLTVNANYKSGISGNDDIEITQAKLAIHSADDGIIANDSVSIKNSDITITSRGNGIKTTNGTKIGKGYFTMKDGSLSIDAAADGIQAETLLYIENGDFKIATSGSDSKSDPFSAKALKGASGIVILNGSFDIDSSDDAIHSNGILNIKGGTFDINSGDDGLHADTALSISGGDITITNSYEGIESASINISGGTIDLKASDDGINAAGGADHFSIGGRPGQSNTTTGSCKLTISGGKINISTSGDSIDVNGSAYMTGGYVLVSGPTNNGNGSLDYDGVFEIRGGTLLVAGGSGMAMAPFSGSTQYTIANTVGAQSAGTKVKLTDSSGNTVAEFTPTKEYRHVVISSPDIKSGETYTLYAGDTKVKTFTISHGPGSE